MKKIALTLTALALLASQAKAQDAITANVNSVAANNYLVNGFSFNNNPTLFINGSATAKFGDSYLTGIVMHSRDIKNHFNGKTQWVEWTGMADVSQDLGPATASIGAYHTFLPADVFGIDGLLSWSHQPLEFGLVLSALGGFLILKNLEKTKLKVFLPFSIISFLFFTTWLVFNLVLIFGHTIQCLPVYKIFLSGCSIL